MKIKALAALSLALATVAALVTFSSSPEAPQAAEAPQVTRKERPEKSRIASQAAEVTEQTRTQRMNESLQDDDALQANLDAWSLRFDQLTAAGTSREQAVGMLLSEIDGVFSQWVAEGIAPLAARPPAERYDELELIAQAVREGAAAVIERLGLPGARHESVAAAAMDLVRAEIEYAEAAPDPASRLAMLRLDRERQQRLAGLEGIADETERARMLSGIDEWYESGLASVFPDEAADEGGE